MRHIRTEKYQDSEAFIDLIVNASKDFNPVMVLRTNEQYFGSGSRYDFLIALGSTEDLTIENDDTEAFRRLNDFQEEHQDWIFGHLSYDLKNSIENLHSNGFDGIGMPLMHFFLPRIMVLGKDHTLHWYVAEGQEQVLKYRVDDLRQAMKQAVLPRGQIMDISLKTRMSKEEYFHKFKKIKRHIQQGDIYEMNFCREFYAEDVKLNPEQLYLRLNRVSPAPFSVYYALDGRYLLSSSPERYLMKSGNRLISQPIKGTAPRFADPRQDEASRLSLLHSDKEKAENVMIVDLVRNDLSRTAEPGTVRVDELFGTYPFAQVWQMISTVSSQPKPHFRVGDFFQTTFPMGSMTGAPKIRAMQLIEDYENTARGLYSGTTGYITPRGDFDFNVIIRSMLYNSKSRYLSFITGGAITSKAKAGDEYRETELKAKGMLTALK